MSVEDSTLSGLLEYSSKYEGKLIVLKFGGALAEDDDIIQTIAKQAAFLRHNLKARIVIVHGGGNQINEMLKGKGIEVRKDEASGLRITDKDTLEISDEVLRKVNSNIVQIFNQASNVSAIGMAGYDAKIITARPLVNMAENFTGTAQTVDTALLQNLLEHTGSDVIPVIYPISYYPEGQDNESRLNVNADEVASAIASQMGAIRLILCSDVEGVLDKKGKRITPIATDDVDHLVDSKTVTGGMITKLREAAKAADKLGESGGVVILDGRGENVIFKELFTDKGAGTLIRSPARVAASSRPHL